MRKTLPQPVGHIGAHRIGPRVGARASQPLEQLGLNQLAERAAGKAEHARERSRE